MTEATVYLQPFCIESAGTEKTSLGIHRNGSGSIVLLFRLPCIAEGFLLLVGAPLVTEQTASGVLNSSGEQVLLEGYGFQVRWAQIVA